MTFELPVKRCVTDHPLAKPKSSRGKTRQPFSANPLVT